MLRIPLAPADGLCYKTTREVCAPANARLPDQLFIALCSVPYDADLWKNRYNPRMKQQILKFVLLLAACAACYGLARFSQTARVSSWIRSLTRASAAPDASTAASTSQLSGSSGSSSLQVPARLAGAAGASDLPGTAVEVLEAAIRELRTIDEFSAAAELSLHLLDQQCEATGRYLQKGQGTPWARWDFEFQIPGVPMRLTQVFDGRFFYRLSDLDGELSLTYVDLLEVPALEHPETEFLAGPGGWFGVGGLPTILEQTAKSFEWEPLAPGTAPTSRGAIQLTVLRGKWKAESLRQLLRDEVAPDALHPEIRWDRLPQQLPHEVEIVLGTDAYLRLFPYQITFRGYGKAGPQGPRTDLITLKLRKVTRHQQLDENDFKVSSDNVQPIDQTADWMARLDMYLGHPLQ